MEYLREKMRLLRFQFSIVMMCLTYVSVAQDFSIPGEREIGSQRELIYDFGFFGSSAGIAFPLGSFRSKDYLNYYSGYADEGYFLNFLKFQHRFSKHYGIGVNWTRSAFNLDEDMYIDPYDDFYPNLTFIGVNEDPWVLHSVLASGILTVPHSFIDLDVRVSAGLGHAIRPDLSITAFETSTGYLALDWDQKRSTINDFAWGFGLNARIHVYKSLDFFFAADYLRMSTRFDVENVYNLSSTETESVFQIIEMIQLGVGFGVRLN